MRLLILLFLAAFSVIEAKIYDCFTFFNELEILEIRLEELYEDVDYFVIVESAETFRGYSKPFNFLENQHLFKKYLDKIIYIPLTERLDTNNPWDREHFQRNAIKKGLVDCQDEDIILISDVDEVPNPRDFPLLIETLLGSGFPILICDHQLLRYFLNRLDTSNTPCGGTLLTTWGFLKNRTPQSIRGEINNRLFPHIESGWHLTSMGGFERFITKIENWSHAEYDLKKNKEYVKIRREASGSFLVKIDESYPRYVQENIELLKEKLFIDTCEDLPLNQIKTFWPHYEQLVARNSLSMFQIPEPYSSAQDLPYDTSGFFDPSILSFLEKMVQEKRVKSIVDVGAWLGLSTQCFALMLPPKGVVYAIDLWSSEEMLKKDPRAPTAYDIFLSNMKHAHVAHKVIPQKKSSLEAAREFKGKADLIYLDTTSQGLYEEILAWLPKKASRGILCGIHAEDDRTKRVVKQIASQLHLRLEERGIFWYLE